MEGVTEMRSAVQEKPVWKLGKNTCGGVYSWTLFITVIFKKPSDSFLFCLVTLFLLLLPNYVPDGRSLLFLTFVAKGYQKT